MSYHKMSCDKKTFHKMTYHEMSCPVMQFYAMSDDVIVVMFCDVIDVMLMLFLSCFVMR